MPSEKPEPLDSEAAGVNETTRTALALVAFAAGSNCPSSARSGLIGVSPGTKAGVAPRAVTSAAS